MRRDLAIFSTDVTQEGSTFQKVDVATEKAQIPLLVLSLGTKGKSKLVDQCWIVFLHGLTVNLNTVAAYKKVSGE